MNLRIIYRSAVIWNVVLHFVLSLLFLVLQQAIYQEKSVFSVSFFKSTLVDFWPILGLVIISSLLVFNLKKISHIVFIVTIGIVSAISAYHLWLEFSKLILLVLFIYILASYYLSFMLKADLHQAFYNPGFSEEDLFDPMLLRIKVDVIENKSGKTNQGYLTNWDEDGCFIKLDELPKEKNLQINFYFKDHVFTELGSITTISKKNKGIGVRFISSNESHGWKEIYRIISDMGMNVEYIK